MAKGYWIARVTTHDPERYKDYVTAATPAYKEYGAKFLVRGGKYDPVEGEGRPRNVVIEFESYDKALACYNSPTYSAARKIRQEISEGELIIVEGYDG